MEDTTANAIHKRGKI